MPKEGYSVGWNEGISKPWIFLFPFSMHLLVSDSDISSCGVPGFIISAALFAADLPKTT